MTPSKNPKRSRSRGLRWLEFLLLAAGVAGLGVWAGSKVIPPIWQAWENRQFDLARNLAKDNSSKENVSPAHPPAQPPAPKNGDVLGRLSIARLNLSSMVREGDDETTLSLALGHIPSTAMPGQTGNVGVAGHRDTLFRALRKIRKDDLIQFETLNGAHVYQVDSMQIVKPDNVGVLKPRAKPTLTLVTCYPFYYIGAAPERFIVSAHEVLPQGVTAHDQPSVGAALEPQAAPPKPSDRNASDATVAPAAVKPVAFRPPAETELPGSSRTDTFEIHKGNSREVAPGVSLGITDTDPRKGTVYGWVYLTRYQRTIQLSDQSAGEPVVLFENRRQRKLRFSHVSSDSATVTVTE